MGFFRFCSLFSLYFLGKSPWLIKIERCLVIYLLYIICSLFFALLFLLFWIFFSILTFSIEFQLILYKIWSLFFSFHFISIYFFKLVLIDFFLTSLLVIWFHFIFTSNLVCILLIVICFVFYPLLIDFFVQFHPSIFVEWGFGFVIFLDLCSIWLVMVSWPGS